MSSLDIIRRYCSDLSTKYIDLNDKHKFNFQTHLDSLKSGIVIYIGSQRATDRDTIAARVAVTNILEPDRKIRVE